MGKWCKKEEGGKKEQGREEGRKMKEEMNEMRARVGMNDIILGRYSSESAFIVSSLSLFLFIIPSHFPCSFLPHVL